MTGGTGIPVRLEGAGDAAAIHGVHDLAFGQREEGDIVDALRRNGAARLSLVAVAAGEIVGHIVYSPVSIAGQVKGAALGPMAVHPDWQRQGVGSSLIRAGNARLKDEGCPCVVVLGHPEYYPRFGFRPASRYGVTCEWPVPEGVFMLLIFDEAMMRGVSGQARYRPEFSTEG